MNAPLPMQARLSLYADTVSTSSGQYFCNDRQFALPVAGNKVERLDSGQQVFGAILAAMNAAERFIWIADWQMGYDVELSGRGPAKLGDPNPHPGRLIKVIEAIISKKPVQVRVLLYRSLKDSIPGTYDKLVANAINAINRKEWPGSVIVLLQGSTSAQYDSFDYSHHQKFVVVDGKIAFLGGIDLSYGRFETPEFDVVIDPGMRVLNEVYNPCASRKRQLTPAEHELVKQGFAKPYTGAMLEEGCQARMPWQDVHVKISGPAAVDVHRNFVRRWNMMVRAGEEAEARNQAMAAALAGGMAWPVQPVTSNGPRESVIRPAKIDAAWLEAHGATQLLKDASAAQAGGCLVQIVRSVSKDHLRQESFNLGRFAAPDDLALYPKAGERPIFEEALRMWVGEHQPNILNAMVNCIRSASSYIYIETQFFISDFGTAGPLRTDVTEAGEFSYYPVDSKRIGNEDDGIKNTIIDELGKKIKAHIAAGTNFHVYLVLPTHPEGSIADGSVWKQHWLALATVHHGSQSLIGRIKTALKDRGRNADDWNKYLTVLNMRNYGVAVQYARDPKTFEEKFDREIGRYVVTEQVYIHSKLLIVDDAVAIVGTANINDRSLTGNGDTEIAAVIVDTDAQVGQDLGDPRFPVVTRTFARDLRRKLWEKHFGFMAKPESYFPSTKRAKDAGATTLDDPIHPPRGKTDAAKFGEVFGRSWKDILEKPCAPETVAAIQTIAGRNRDAYEAVFSHTPRNGMKGFEDILQHYTVPYSVIADGDARMANYQEDRRYTDRRTSIMLDAGGHPSEETVARLKKADEDHQQRSISIGVSAKRTLGVVPPALQTAYMTRELLPHQRAAAHAPLSEFQSRYVTYEGGAVHNVGSAIGELSRRVTGFLVLMPLNWGDGVIVDEGVVKELSVDLASANPDPAPDAARKA